MCPHDASLRWTKQPSGEHTVAIQRHYGLYLSGITRADWDTLVQGGVEHAPDYLGDWLANAGEKSTRHRLVVGAWRNALSAVATGPVVLGDKQGNFWKKKSEISGLQSVGQVVAPLAK